VYLQAKVIGIMEKPRKNCPNNCAGPQSDRLSTQLALEPPHSFAILQVGYIQVGA